MRVIDAREITAAVAELCVSANVKLPDSLKNAVAEAAMRETHDGARDILKQLQTNAVLAETESLPVCQDTGYACVFLDIGTDVHIEGDVNEAVNKGVGMGYISGYLRASIVSDPLRRENTGDNTPAALYLRIVPGHSILVTVAPKGFGSENKSAIKMLNPSDGRDGVIDFVIETVKKAGASACPPVVIGMGIGGTFDMCACNAKRALLREVGERNSDAYYAQLEDEILSRINCLGIGPAGFGGDTTALGVSIIAAPTHIAGLPVAVNVSCHVTRHASRVI